MCAGAAMSVAAMLGLALAMMALAALPSSSVLLVVACSLRGGRRHGLAAALGIVIGDLLFVGLAIGGVAALAQAMGAVFIVVKVAAALLLLSVGLRLLLSSRAGRSQALPAAPGSLCTSAIAGLVVTLADVKAVVFYASLLPLFVDMQSVLPGDVLAIAAITVAAVGGVKLLYVLLAQRLVQGLPVIAKRGEAAAGVGLIAASGVLLLKD